MSGRMGVQVRPISAWPGKRTTYLKKSPFQNNAGRPVPWSKTMDLLERELYELGAKRVVIEADFRDDQLRLDGWPYADARPASPAVILSFESKHGPLRYPCDTFTDWQANVRAIALALEALRKVDRYGVTRRGEQYTGWKKLPPAGAGTVTMEVDAAAAFVAAASGMLAYDLMTSRAAMTEAYRTAAKRLHPDAGGTDREFALLGAAKAALDAHHGTL